jgi:transposase-like protein
VYPGVAQGSGTGSRGPETITTGDHNDCSQAGGAGACSWCAAVIDVPAMRDRAIELVEQARTDGVALTGEDDLLTALVQHSLQTGLEVEDERAPPPYAPRGPRLGQQPQWDLTEHGHHGEGKVRLDMPRDPSTSQPQTVRKGQRRLDGLTGNVISLYGKRMTTGDIQATSPRSTSVVEMAAWQHRSLDAVHPGRATDTARTVMMKGVLKALLHE